LNAIDANPDLAPFDSISNPNRSVRGENNPSLNQRRPVVPINNGISARPEMDSFYMDRNDVKYKQTQNNNPPR
jgi:hypothetical protein